MFNWFKKTAVDVKETSEPDIAAIQDGDTITPLAMSESIALKEQGNAYLNSDKLEAAAECFRQAIARNPRYAEAYTNLGLIFQMQGNMDEAIALYRKAVVCKPDLLTAHINLGIALMDAQGLPEAEVSFRRALELEPNLAQTHYHLGFLLLSLGRYAEAWPYYERRYDPNIKNPVFSFPNFPYPQWRGESLVGKSLVIWSEQGYGDNIQFVRYAQLLRNRGVSRLALVCAPPLKSLLETLVGVDEVITELACTASYDYWSLPLSLPLHFGTIVETVPVPLPYLYALPARVERWRERLPQGKFKVGLVWKGNAGHVNDDNRSLPGLSTLAPLWSVQGVDFISLQKDQGEQESKNPPVNQPIIHLGSDIDDFADTAAIVEQLDLVICVDTSIAHVAGAMGKPCWVMLPAIGTDWRWLREREDCPWYPSLRLFRQQEMGNWDLPVEQIHQKLLTIIQVSS